MAPSELMHRLKKRLPRMQRPGHHPVLEKHRVWHDPIVEIYDNPEGRTGDVGASVRAYDVANRRWYQLDVDAYAGDDRMAQVVQKHIRAYHNGHRRPPRWNVIKTTLKGTPVAYATKPEEEVCYTFKERLVYGGADEDRFPVVQFKDLRDKVYLSKGADLCSWGGNRQSVFKRIEVDPDVSAFDRAIRNREKLIKCIEGEVADAKDVYNEMERRFNVVPIHAVVVMDESPGPWAKGTVAGILMPFAGTSLDMVAEKGPVNVNESQLVDLTRGIKELNRYDVTHGDICDWNVSWQPTLDLSRNGPDGGKLVLLDLGNVAPDYEGDASLLGDLFLWCLDHSQTLQSNPDAKRRVSDAAFTLKTKHDFALAIETLLSGDKPAEKEEEKKPEGNNAEP